MENKTKTSTILKFVSGGLEALLGIPFLGGMIVITLFWTPLALMLALHIVTLVFSLKEEEKKHGSILGIVTSVIGWIPLVGMIMHIVTGVLLIVDAYKANAVVQTDVETHIHTHTHLEINTKEKVETNETVDTNENVDTNETVDTNEADGTSETKKTNEPVETNKNEEV